ncbi:MAG: transposase [Pseudohongiellaceae bacterium]
MTRARYQQISIEDTPYYHCISRCVRRAYLCGNDPVTGKNFDHRKAWLVTRIKELSSQFAVDICAYAVMSNHYHLVLHVNQTQADDWSDAEVIERWTNLFPRNGALIETLVRNNSSKAAQKQLSEKVSLWRERLMDISWFMRCLNETVARNANREDRCSGRFWEGRFKSQALLDEKALVTCMAYVDLNPIRAHMATSLETSDFTSIQERLLVQARRIRNKSTAQQRLVTRKAAKHLLDPSKSDKQFMLAELEPLKRSFIHSNFITTKNYLSLLNTTARALGSTSEQKDKAETQLTAVHKSLSQLGISPRAWLLSVKEFHKFYPAAAGSTEALFQHHQTCIRAGVNYKHPGKWIRGVKSSQALYVT